MIEMLAMLIIGHAICDYPLQGDFLAQGKNRHTAVGKGIWPHALSAHAIIHGGAVWLVTGSLLLGSFEVAAHAAIDFTKCEGKIGFHTDQALHIACKILWVVTLIWIVQ